MESDPLDVLFGRFPKHTEDGAMLIVFLPFPCSNYFLVSSVLPMIL